MDTDSKAHSISQTDDNSQAAGTGGACVRVNLVGFDRPLVVAIAVTIGLVAIGLAWQAEREARLAEYYAVDLEMKMAAAGLHPNPDPWVKHEGAKK